MKKIIYVCDSFHTNVIVEAIKKAMPGFVVYSDSTIFSQGSDIAATAFNKIVKDITEKASEKDEIMNKVDIFLLSAKLICDGSVNPKELKEKYGNNKSKIVAISLSSYFLEKVGHLVDITEGKDVFFDSKGIQRFFNNLK